MSLVLRRNTAVAGRVVILAVYGCEIEWLRIGGSKFRKM